MKPHELEHVISQTKKAKNLQTFDVPTIFLARHGETEFNKENKLRGWKDVPLTEKGKQQAHDLATKLSKYKIGEIHCSDMDRAVHTAKVVANVYMNPPKVQPTKELRPWHQGYLEGQNVDKILPIMKHYIEHYHEKMKDGESFATFTNRYLTYLGKMMREAKKNIGPAILLVAHTRNIRAACAWIAKDMKSLDRKILESKEDPVSTGGVEMIQFKDGKWSYHEI